MVASKWLAPWSPGLLRRLLGARPRALPLASRWAVLSGVPALLAVADPPPPLPAASRAWLQRAALQAILAACLQFATHQQPVSTGS